MSDPTPKEIRDAYQDYRDARLMGWQFNDEKCLCPTCAAPKIILQ